MRRLLAILGAIAACILAPCANAAITATAAGATSNVATGTTTLALPLTIGASVGDTIAVAATYLNAVAARTAVDNGGNTYTEASTVCTYNTNNKLSMFYAKVTTAVAAPVTATGAITTTTVNFTTNPGTLAANQSITGAGVTTGTLITGTPSQWNGTIASASVNNSQSVISESLTVSSSVVLTWTTSAKAAMGAAVLTGLSTSSPLDVQGACTSGNSTSASIGTGTLTNASEVVLGVMAASGSISAYASNSPFTADLTGSTASNAATIEWGYVVVAATTGVTYAPTWTSTRQYGANVWTFTAPGAAVTNHNMLLLGVGQ